MSDGARQGYVNPPVTRGPPSQTVSATNSGSWRQMSRLSRVRGVVSYCIDILPSFFSLVSDTPPVILDILDIEEPVVENSKLNPVSPPSTRQGFGEIGLTGFDMSEVPA